MLKGTKQPKTEKEKDKKIEKKTERKQVKRNEKKYDKDKKNDVFGGFRLRESTSRES